jgi:hypothetical protein
VGGLTISGWMIMFCWDFPLGTQTPLITSVIW